MKIMRASLIGILGYSLLFWFSGVLTAHHVTDSFYDMNSAVTLNGSITRVAIMNPHSFVFLDVRNANSEMEHWAVELPPIASLKNLGGTLETLRVGDRITVSGNPWKRVAASLVPKYYGVITEAAAAGHAVLGRNVRLSNGIEWGSPPPWEPRTKSR